MKFKEIKILQLVDTLSLGGTERMSVNIANALVEEGVESHLVVSRKIGPLQSYLHPDVKIISLHKRKFWDIFAFMRLRKYVLDAKVDILHAHSTSIFWAVLLKITYPKVKLIWHDHFGLSDQLYSNPRNEMQWISRWIDGIIVVSEKLLDWWQNKLSHFYDKIVLLNNFPHLANLTSKRNGVPVILNLANFRPQKDQLNLLEAAKILSDKGISFRLILVGDFVDKTWHQLVIEKIALLDLDQKVEVHGPVESVKEVLEIAHVGVLSSDSEGLPIALLEYGLAALPVVCTSVGNCQEVISSDKYGWIVPPKDPESLANALQSVLMDYSNAIVRGENLKNRVSEKYGAKQFLINYKILIESILR